MAWSRREFLYHSAATSVAAAAPVLDKALILHAESLEQPLGLQLFTVMEQLQKDFDGTLHRIHTIGYREVEMAGFFGKKPTEIKTSIENAGLHCASVHLFDPGPASETMDYAMAIGAKYVVTALYLLKREPDDSAYMTMVKRLTLDDYKVVAEQCNRLGEQARSHGLVFAYHNENVEFRPLEGTTGYDELLRSTDPKLVKLELDCGWMAAAGQNPTAYITKYPGRYRMLHIKDFKYRAKPSYGSWPGESPEPTELGRGHIDYKPILDAAKRSGIEWYYVEQEAPFRDMPVMGAIKVDYEYVRKLI